MDVSLSKPQEIGTDREAWSATVPGVTVERDLGTEQQQQQQQRSLEVSLLLNLSVFYHNFSPFILILLHES